jgi:hypothetical protein
MHEQEEVMFMRWTYVFDRIRSMPHSAYFGHDLVDVRSVLGVLSQHPSCRTCQRLPYAQTNFTNL